MKRLLVLSLLAIAAVSALAAEPLAVRVTVYQRLPETTAEGAVADPENPGTLVAPPAGGWPASFDGVRQALAARRKGRMSVLVSTIHEAKPLEAGRGAAFFVGELARAVEVKADGDVLLPDGKHATMSIAPNTTAVFGAADEQIYVAFSVLGAAAKDDAVVIANGEKPLDVVSRVEPKFPVIETMHHRTGIVLTQLRVEPDGSVSSINVLQRVQPQIEAAAVAALKQWRFEPAKRDGKPVAAYMMMSTAFRIE